MELKGIGMKRANRILEIRITKTFKSVLDLQRIDMNEKSIRKFVTNNIKDFLNLDKI